MVSLVVWSKGIRYRSFDDVKALLFKTSATKALEFMYRKMTVNTHQGQNTLLTTLRFEGRHLLSDACYIGYDAESDVFDMEALESATEVLRREIFPLADLVSWRKDLRDVPFFKSDGVVFAIPQRVFSLVAHAAGLVRLGESLFLSEDERNNIEMEIEDKVDLVREMGYKLTVGGLNIEDQPCIIWLCQRKADGELVLDEVSTGIPSRLLGSPLSSGVIYRCMQCDHHERSTGDIVDFYYDSNRDYYCSTCASTAKDKGLRHVGE